MDRAISFGFFQSNKGLWDPNHLHPGMMLPPVLPTSPPTAKLSPKVPSQARRHFGKQRVTWARTRLNGTMDRGFGSEGLRMPWKSKLVINFSWSAEPKRLHYFLVGIYFINNSRVDYCNGRLDLHIYLYKLVYFLS